MLDTIEVSHTKEDCIVEEGEVGNFYIYIKATKAYDLYLCHATNSFVQLTDECMNEDTFCDGIDFHSEQEAKDFLDAHFTPVKHTILYTKKED